LARRGALAIFALFAVRSVECRQKLRPWKPGGRENPWLPGRCPPRRTEGSGGNAGASRREFAGDGGFHFGKECAERKYLYFRWPPDSTLRIGFFVLGWKWLCRTNSGGKSRICESR